MGKTVKKTEKLTETLQVPLTKRDRERIEAHPLIKDRLTQAAPLARKWILERLAQEEKGRK